MTEGNLLASSEELYHYLSHSCKLNINPLVILRFSSLYASLEDLK
jgi:hypothetical protein